MTIHRLAQHPIFLSAVAFELDARHQIAGAVNAMAELAQQLVLALQQAGAAAAAAQPTSLPLS